MTQANKPSESKPFPTQPDGKPGTGPNQPGDGTPSEAKPAK